MDKGYTECWEEFLALEKDLNLFRFKVDDVYIWERIRFETFQTIIEKRGLWSQPITEIDKTITNMSKGLYLWAKNLISRNPYFSSEHKYLFMSMGRREKREDGKWWDIYCDPIYETLGLDYLHVEPPYMNCRPSPTKTKNIRFIELIEYTGTILRELGLATYDPAPQIRQRCKEIQQEINRTFGVSVNIEDLVRFRLSVRKSLRPLYKRFLKSVNPSLVFVIPSVLRHVVIDVCKELDIITIELQHGVLSNYEYGFPANRTKHTFPDFFFSWGDFWNSKVDLPLPAARIRSVGFPYFEQERQRYQTDQKDNTILFISQGNIGEDLSKFAVNLEQHPEINPSNIVYKLHPGEYDRWQSDYPWLVDTELEVISREGRNLYELFADADAQVGVYSTAIFEGLGFGVSTYLVDLPGVELLAELYTGSHATLVSSTDDLASSLMERQAHEVDVSEFFKPNAIQNFSEEIERVLASNTTFESP